MFANTLTLTIGGVAKTLTRRNQDNFGSVYRFIAGDGTELIEMRIRHSVDTTPKGLVDRANVYIEQTVYATPTSAERYWSFTTTLRRLKTSSPDSLLALAVAANALIATLDQDLVLGDN